MFKKVALTGAVHGLDVIPQSERSPIWFNSGSGHMPGLQDRSLARGVCEAPNGCFSHTAMFLSLSFSLPSSLSKNLLKVLSIYLSI